MRRDIPLADNDTAELDDLGTEFTDAHLAAKFADEVLEGRWLWVRGLGWHRWEGRRWEPAPDEAVTETARHWVVGKYEAAASRISRALAAEQKPSAADTDALASWKRFASRSRIESLAALGRGLSQRDARDFDAHPDLLNCGNGIVNLRTGELLPHDPGKLLTKLTACDYHPGAEHRDWKAALEALPADVRDWYQLHLGQGITGHMTPNDKMLIQQGSGENGKTTLVGGIWAAAGDYYLNVSHRALLADVRSIPTEVADFRGMRLAVLEELPDERQLPTVRLKQLVGTPEINARHLFKDSFTFTASHTMIVNSNPKPIVTESDHATWRRLAMVRFPYRFWMDPEDVKGPNDRLGDPGLRDRLRTGTAQREAVLAWLVQGAVRWYAVDRVMPPLPERVQRDTRQWRGESDLLLCFLDEQMFFAPEPHVMASELLEEFNSWLERRGHKPWSARLFAERLESHDEITSNRVEKRIIRFNIGLSRPAGSRSRPQPKQYQAWLGMRFRTAGDHLPDEQDQCSDLGEDQGVMDVMASRNLSQNGLSRGKGSGDPSHPSHTPSGELF